MYLIKEFSYFNNKRLINSDIVINHIKRITPDESDIPDYFISKYISGRKFELVDYDLLDLLDTDVSFKEYFDSGEDRYEDVDMTDETLYEYIVVVDGILMDGYSRSSNLLRRGVFSTKSYNAI